MGIDQEYFYIQRGNYFHKLQLFSLALGNYKTALEKYNSTDQFLKSSIGYCYMALGNYEQSLKMYRQADEQSKHPDILVGLVYAELNNENYDESVKIFKELLSKENQFDKYHIDEVESIKSIMQQEGITEEKYV